METPTQGKIDSRVSTQRLQSTQDQAIDVLYITSQPAVWFVYYDSYEGAGDGSSATVGAQNQDGELLICKI